jgi:hypothetical protein
LTPALIGTFALSKELGKSILKLQILEWYLLPVITTVHASLEHTISGALNIEYGLHHV